MSGTGLQSKKKFTFKVNLNFQIFIVIPRQAVNFEPFHRVSTREFIVSFADCKTNYKMRNNLRFLDITKMVSILIASALNALQFGHELLFGILNCLAL